MKDKMANKKLYAGVGFAIFSFALLTLVIGKTYQSNQRSKVLGSWWSRYFKSRNIEKIDPGYPTNAPIPPKSTNTPARPKPTRLPPQPIIPQNCLKCDQLKALKNQLKKTISQIDNICNDSKPTRSPYPTKYYPTKRPTPAITYFPTNTPALPKR